MTTDITELALLVSKAKASVFTLEYISQFEPADIDSDDVDLRFEVDGRDTGTNVSIVDECGQAARVIGALVEALELKEEQRANWFQMAQKLGEDLDAAEKRIAELESRTVKLPPKIERVDADVSDRNQPGMVVAVHIDAGDFVKFRDQVYEVKETDFDDHDVTLWFVCGEVLKCAAGCQIEVVSAPVEDE